MMDFSKENPITRRNALAVITLGSLLVTVAIAWMLSATINPLLDGESWFLVTVSDQPIGWQISASTGTKSGKSGYDMSARLLGQGVLNVDQSTWELNSDETEGKYVAANFRMTARGQVMQLPSTVIVLKRPQVGIARSGPAGKLTRELEVGSDYIAEGKLNELILQCARSGQAVIGQIVIDDRVDLVDVQIKPVELPDNSVEGSQVVKKTVSGYRFESLYYVVDGQIDRIETYDAAHPDTAREVACRVKPEVVLDSFPVAVSLRNELIKGN